MTIQKSHKHVTYFPAQQLYKHSIGFVMPPVHVIHFHQRQGNVVFSSL